LPNNDDHQRTLYLARAKDAQARAEQSDDEANKAAWLQIAAEYHLLAAQLSISDKDRGHCFL
jgi:hypothetical protein